MSSNEIITITKRLPSSVRTDIYTIDINCSRNCETDDFALVLFGIALHQLGIQYTTYSNDRFAWAKETHSR